MTNQCQHGQLARVCLTCEQAAEIAQLRQYLEAAQRRGEELRAQVAALTENGPPMQRGTTIEGTPWMGTMREVLEDYKSAADTEARWGDEARAEAAGLREEVALYASTLESRDRNIEMLRADNTRLQNEVVMPLRERVRVLEDALRLCVEQFQKPFQLHVSAGDLQVLDAARAALGDKP